MSYNAALATELARITALISGATDAPRELQSDEANPLNRLCTVFSLTDFERDILMLCAGMELDTNCAAAIAHNQNGEGLTFLLALARLPGAHWSALMPTAPLRHWRLVTVASGPSLVGSALRIDERILHELLGLRHLDARLSPRITMAAPITAPDARQSDFAQTIAVALSDAGDSESAPIVQLRGVDLGKGRQLATMAAQVAGRQLLVLDARDLPSNIGALDAFLRLVDRELLLADAALLVVCGDNHERSRAVEVLLDRLRGVLMLATTTNREPWPMPGWRRLTTLDVE